MDWLNTLAGFGVGAMVGVTGVGGGALMTPILVLLFGVAPAAGGHRSVVCRHHQVGGRGVHHSKGSVDWQVLRRLALGSLPTSIVTQACLHLRGMGQLKNGFILNALGAVLLLTALAMVFKKRSHALGQRLRATAPDQFKRAQPALTVVAGAILGFLVTLTSVGVGALGR